MDDDSVGIGFKNNTTTSLMSFQILSTIWYHSLSRALIADVKSSRHHYSMASTFQIKPGKHSLPLPTSAPETDPLLCAFQWTGSWVWTRCLQERTAGPSRLEQQDLRQRRECSGLLDSSTRSPLPSWWPHWGTPILTSSGASSLTTRRGWDRGGSDEVESEKKPETNRK